MLPAASNRNPNADGLNNTKSYGLHKWKSCCTACFVNWISNLSQQSPMVFHLSTWCLLHCKAARRVATAGLSLSLERKLLPEVSSHWWELGHSCKRSVQRDGIASTDLSPGGGMDVEKPTPMLPTENHIIKMGTVYLAQLIYKNARYCQMVARVRNSGDLWLNILLEIQD